MSLQEIWKIKENLSDKFWGKSVDEINDIIKPSIDDMKRKIEELRRKKEQEQRTVLASHKFKQRT